MMRKAQYLEIIIITSCIIGLLGWLTFRSFSPLRPKHWQKETTQNSVTLNEGGREPSSEGTSEDFARKGETPPGVTVITVNCAQRQSLEIESTTPFIRIRTTECAKLVDKRLNTVQEAQEVKGNDSGDVDVSVTSLTTGYTATVVTLPDGDYTTDYIDLNAGSNQILIAIGESTKEVFSQEIMVIYTAP